MPTITPDRPDASSFSALDRILVVGGSKRAVDLLRLATIRSDDVVLVAEHIDAVALRFARRFAIETRERPFSDSDLADASVALVALGDEEAENSIVRSARRRHVGIHVVDRPLVSDFTLLALLEHPSLATLAA